MKKSILFVIDTLNIGGAEKSLISLLNIVDIDKYEIDLLLFKKGGDYEKYIPKSINILPPPEYFQYVNSEKISKGITLTYFYHRVKTSVKLRVNNYKKNGLHEEQVVFKSLEKILFPLDKKYDIAIAYSQGMPTYFVANKVNANKKLAWINTDYKNSHFDKDIDFESYKKIDKIIAVSEYTKQSISNIRFEYSNNVHMLLDIVNPETIYEMAQEFYTNEFEDSVVNILTVGRLDKIKAYDKAIEVAKLLKETGYKFKWYGIGEGPERKKLQCLIEKHKVNDYFILLGKKINPYPYMKNCDIYVQTSEKEGFGLTVSEAKILKRPIVCTNFATANEIIDNNLDGLIVDHDIVSIFNGIKRYIDDKDFKNKIVSNLDLKEPYKTTNQLYKFYELIDF